MFGKPSECHLSRPAHLGMPLYRLLVCPRTETAEWMFVVWCWAQREQREKLGSGPLSRARVFERDKSVFIEWAGCKPLIVWHWSVHSATSPSITNSLPTERCLDKEKESSYFFFFVLELHSSCRFIGEGEEPARVGMPQQFCGKTGGAKRSEEEDGLLVWSGVQLYRFSHVRLTDVRGWIVLRVEAWG